MRNRNVITVDGRARPVACAVGQVSDQPVSMEVEVDPTVARSSLRAPRHRSCLLGAVLAGLLVLAGCGDADDADDADAPSAAGSTGSEAADAPEATPATVAPPVEEQLFPDVVEAELTSAGDGTFTVAATVSSPYDTPERYADAWRVVAPDGTVLGVRELAHDHQNEQPFTRQLTGVEIPEGVDEVTIEGRDQVSGWGGGTVTIPVPEG